MARVNVGINPTLLSDQHLIAESVEITMITGMLRKDNFKIKSIPERFSLGKGHINFFKNKILYLSKRLESVNNEMRQRGFKPGTTINLDEYPDKLKNYWSPLDIDSDIVRDRIIERLNNPLKAKKTFHKFYGKPINNLTLFCNNLKNSNTTTW